jgi:hypothetical protein
VLLTTAVKILVTWSGYMLVITAGDLLMTIVCESLLTSFADIEVTYVAVKAWLLQTIGCSLISANDSLMTSTGWQLGNQQVFTSWSIAADSWWPYLVTVSWQWYISGTGQPLALSYIYGLVLSLVLFKVTSPTPPPHSNSIWIPKF